MEGGLAVAGVVRLRTAVRAQEVLGAARRAVAATVATADRRDRRPQREAVEGEAKRVEAVRVELGHVDGAARHELSLRQRVNLRAVELRAEERVLVGGQEDASGVGPDVRVVAEACGRVGRQRGRLLADGLRRRRAVVVRRASGAVVLNRDPEDGPAAERVGRVAHGEVQMVGAGEMLLAIRAGVGERVQGQDHDEPPAGGCVVDAGRVGDERTEGDRGGRPDDRGCIAVEGVERDRSGQRGAACGEDAERVVHDLEDAGVARAVAADTEALVGRFEAELVRRAKALLEMVDAFEAGDEPRGRVGHGLGLADRSDRRRVARAAVAAVENLGSIAARCRRLVGLDTGGAGRLTGGKGGRSRG